MAKFSSLKISRKSLAVLLFSAVENYNRECLGFLYGYSPKKDRSRLILADAIQLSAVSRRTSSGIEQSKRAADRLIRFCNSVPNLFRYVGFFHSHPSTRQYNTLFTLSDLDRKMIEPDDEFSLLITIIRRGKRLLRWCSKARKTRLRGSLGDFDFHITAYCPVRDAEQKPILDEDGFPKVERMPIIVSRSVIQMLNCMIKKQ